MYPSHGAAICAEATAGQGPPFPTPPNPGCACVEEASLRLPAQLAAALHTWRSTDSWLVSSGWLKRVDVMPRCKGLHIASLDLFSPRLLSKVLIWDSQTVFCLLESHVQWRKLG